MIFTIGIILITPLILMLFYGISLTYGELITNALYNGHRDGPGNLAAAIGVVGIIGALLLCGNYLYSLEQKRLSKEQNGAIAVECSK